MADTQDKAFGLTEKQKGNYSSSVYYILKANSDGTYSLVQSSGDTTLKDNTVEAVISHKELKVVSKDGLKSSTVEMNERLDSLDDTIKIYDVPASLKKDITDEVTISVSYDKSIDSLKLGKVILASKNKYLPGNLVVDLADYNEIVFSNNSYKMLNDKGSFNENWEYNFTATDTTLGTNDFELKMNNFDKDASYYCMFKVIDVFNNIGYSNLIKIK